MTVDDFEALHSNILTCYYLLLRMESDDPVKRFVEISGIAMSPKIRAPSGFRAFYGINDGGGGNRLGVFDSGNGKRLLTFQIPSNIITNIDWETMTIGSCGISGESDYCIYIGDIGDNPARVSKGRNSRRSAKTGYRILKIKEPNYKNFPDNYMLPASRFSVLPYNYLDSSSPTRFADSEAFFLDHTGWGEDGAKGDIYILPKWGQGRQARENNRVFKIPASAWPNEYGGATAPMYSPKTIGTYIRGNDGIMGKTVTSAEMSTDGTVIAVGTTTTAYLFLRCPGVSVADAIASADAEPCHSWKHPSSGQVESFAWYPDGESVLQIPEGANRRMGWTRLDYDVDKSSKVCSGYRQGEREVKWVCRSIEDDATFPDEVCIAAAENNDNVFGHRD